MNFILNDRYKKEREAEHSAAVEFQLSESHRQGQLVVLKVIAYLASIGYYTTNISTETIAYPDGQNYLTPFNILALSPYYSFVADVKYKSNWSSALVISQFKVNLYNQYKRDVEVNDKLVIVYTAYKERRYLSLDTIKNCLLISEQYIIRGEDTKSIVLLRKLLEKHTLEAM